MIEISQSSYTQTSITTHQLTPTQMQTWEVTETDKILFFIVVKSLNGTSCTSDTVVNSERLIGSPSSRDSLWWKNSLTLTITWPKSSSSCLRMQDMPSGMDKSLSLLLCSDKDHIETDQISQYQEILSWTASDKLNSGQLAHLSTGNKTPVNNIKDLMTLLNSTAKKLVSKPYHLELTNMLMDSGSDI